MQVRYSIQLKGDLVTKSDASVYDRLNTNIPKMLMGFSDIAFPAESLLFPRREDVRDYVIRYAKDIRHLITFSTQVEDITCSSVEGNEKWTVTSSSTVTSEKSTTTYDAVVVSNGHYSVGAIPDIPGIKAFHDAYPTVISHAKSYRSPDVFKEKKVIVVGSGPSGLDIGTQISFYSKLPLLNSVQSSSTIQFNQDSKEEVPPIAEYIIEDRSVRFTDGRIEKGIDAVIYCTGYLYSYPFLESLKPPVVTDGHRVRGLYKQLFNISHPTLAFTALPQRVIPFPLSEVQGAAIAKVWSNKLALPPNDEMMLLEQKQVEELGDGTSFHLLGYPKDAQYINEFHDWVGTAEDGFAKEPIHWGEKECWLRENFVDLRIKFVETGGRAKTMEELGFNFDKHEK